MRLREEQADGSLQYDAHECVRMAAQANRLGAVSDNIANSSTTGYKRASMEFASLVLGRAEPKSTSPAASGYAIGEQAPCNFTTGDGHNHQGRLLCRDLGKQSNVPDAKAGSFV